MNSQNIHRGDKEPSPGRDDLFKTLHACHRFFHDHPHARHLREKFPATTKDFIRRDAIAGALGDFRSHYEQVIGFVEKEAVRNEYREDLLLLQRSLYIELENLLTLRGKDPRHRFIIAIPVADRPRMLKNCLDSLAEQCRMFQYGGTSRNSAGSNVFNKVNAFIIDDSRDESCRSQIRGIASAVEHKGVRTHYLGLDDQKRFLNQIPKEFRKKCSALLGAEATHHMPHKGASIIRNIASLWMNAHLKKSNENTLIYFVDSDEEFRITVTYGQEIEDKPFINYFYWLDRIFSTTETEVLTGKVVGDPPVSPTVMINTFLDDLISFFSRSSALPPKAPCGFHNKTASKPFSAEYHDLAALFGYQKPLSTVLYRCGLKGVHTLSDCFADFAQKASGFFSGFHPTRTQLYNHTGHFMKTEAARTVYTGNYVCNAEGLRNFIPFADLKLRMAGPTLGRILTAKIGNRFASANLPILHRRTIPNTHTDEFRSGISIGQYSIDLSGEFRRQFWGDVMLFSIEAIAESECPCTEMSSQSIRDTVQEIQGSIWKLYREKQAASGGKIRKIRDYLSDPHCWWNTEGTMQDSIERFGLFCDSAEQNFGLDSQSMKELAHQIKEGANTRSIIEAIHSLHRDKLLWEELLEMDLTVPDPDQ